MLVVCLLLGNGLPLCRKHDGVLFNLVLVVVPGFLWCTAQRRGVESDLRVFPLRLRCC